MTTYLIVGEAEGVCTSIPSGSVATRAPLAKEVLDEVGDQLPLHLAEILLEVVRLELLAHQLKLSLRLSHPLDRFDVS